VADVPKKIPALRFILRSKPSCIQECNATLRF
jgi:hypothetical protein